MEFNNFKNQLYGLIYSTQSTVQEIKNKLFNTQLGGKEEEIEWIDATWETFYEVAEYHLRENIASELVLLYRFIVPEEILEVDKNTTNETRKISELFRQLYKLDDIIQYCQLCAWCIYHKLTGDSLDLPEAVESNNENSINDFTNNISGRFKLLVECLHFILEYIEPSKDESCKSCNCCG